MPSLGSSKGFLAGRQSPASRQGSHARLGKVLRVVLVAVSIGLPVVLLVSAFQSYRAVNQMRLVYLKNRAATIALQLELLPFDAQRIDEIVASEIDIAGIRLFAAPLPPADPESAKVNAIFTGKALYFSEEERPLFRSYLPVHHSGSSFQFQVARIETYSAAADFLVRDALRHLSITLLAAVGSLATLGAYLLLLRRSTRLAHLAQLGTMSAALAHEIRNPLGAIKGFVQLAREKSSAAAAGYLDTAVSEIGRLEKLVRELLLFARPRQPVLRPVAWNTVVERLQTAGWNGQGQPAFEPHDGLAVVGDTDSLVEILSNLIRNAAEANPGGDVRVSAKRDGKLVRIHVEDDGEGIAEQDRERIFEPFFSTKSAGTGLGLPISRALARQLHAHLELLARAPRGTLARLTLPAAPLQGEPDGTDPRR